MSKLPASNLSTVENQTLAIAGIFQAVHLCKSLATNGHCDSTELQATLSSILTVDTARAIDAYGGSSNSISRGLRIIKSQLGGNVESRDLDIARYALTVMRLGSNVMKDHTTLDQLRIGITRIQAMELAADDPSLVSNMANLYRNSISHLSPRIMVSGNPDYLNSNEIASTIRASLLGGIRSVVLWRQCGGTRPRLVFWRAAYIRQAETFLTS